MNYIRSKSGTSLVELLVATVVMSFVASGILGLTYLNWKTNQRIENKTDGATAARQAIDRIAYEIRQARSVGDYYGVVMPPTMRVVDDLGTNDVTTDISVVHQSNLPSGEVEAGTATLASPQFPAPGNPQYDNSSATITGWLDGQSAPYTLGNDCLILQEPIFTTTGFPRAYNVAGGPQPIECLDTWVYKVVRDTRPDHPNEYILQCAGFPGPNSTMPANLRRRPQTILTGITGPMGPNGTPRVFQFLESSNQAPIDTVPWANVHDISGVLVHLEIRRQQASNTATQVGGQQAYVAFKQEIYLRNNSLTTVSATPSN